MENIEELIKQTIREMFEQGDIEIKTDISEDHDGKFIETVVNIDGTKVFRNEERLYLRF